MRSRDFGNHTFLLEERGSELNRVMEKGTHIKRKKGGDWNTGDRKKERWIIYIRRKDEGGGDFLQWL